MNHHKQQTQINEERRQNAQPTQTAKPPQHQQRAEAARMHRDPHDTTKSDRKAPSNQRQKQRLQKEETQTRTRHYRKEQTDTTMTAQRRREAQTTEARQTRAAD